MRNRSASPLPIAAAITGHVDDRLTGPGYNLGERFREGEAT
jgi:hypothetical protein